MSSENYDPCFPDQPVVDRYLPIWGALPSFRNKPAFTWADDSGCATRSSITYSQLNSSVDSIASNLLSRLHRGDTLLVLTSPGLPLIKILFACQRAGLIAVPLIPQTSPQHHHLLRAISQTCPKAAIADPGYISAICHLAPKHLCWLSTEDLNLDSDSDSNPNSPYVGCKPDDTYLVQYTSGSTGIPKPVLVTAGAAAHNARAARKAYDLHPDSVIISWLPQYHDCGLMFLLLTVVSGATCVLTSPAAFLRRPRLWLELISEFKATCTPVPSFTLPLVSRRGGTDNREPLTNSKPTNLELSTLKNLVLINEPIYADSVTQFIDKFARVGLNPACISPSYGLAENCTFVSTAWKHDSIVPSYRKLLPSARLASSDEEEMNIMVVDGDTFEPVEDGEEGEIWVSSPSNAAGYLCHPSLTREVFYGRLAGRSGRCFVRTGDVGVVRGEGRYLYVVGRISDVIIGRRNLVHPHYLETAAYNARPESLRGGCIAAFGDGSEVVVVAELQKRGGSGGSYRKLCEEVREAVVKEEGVEIGVVVLVESGSVPKTTSGKLRRWEVREKLAGGRLPMVFKVRFGEQGEVGCFGMGGRGGGGGGGGGEGSVVLLSSGGERRQPLRSFL